MQVHFGYGNAIIQLPVVTLGIFDGVHLGHRHILGRLVSKAREVGGESVVVTFYPHPRLVLEGSNSFVTLLTTLQEKTELLEKCGIDHLIIVEFTREFSNITACDFISEILVGQLGAKYLIIGYNHQFGRRREGDFDTIVKCAGSLNLDIERVEGLVTDQGTISSSMVREALLEGRVEDAARLLGYYYQVKGTVIEGRKLGRTIGFPTANILPTDNHKLIPLKGVYAVEVYTGGKIYHGMLSIGSNPTVNKDEGFRSIEVHLLDFHGDIYGSEISVTFRKRLRDERRFDSVDGLTAQMELDRQSTLMVFSGK